MPLICGAQMLDLSKTKVMGILNITPDSFSDGGKFMAMDAALKQTEQMLQAGAAIIDVGGESTRPGAKTVTTAQELERVIPIIAAVAKRFATVISVDTSTPEVMLEAAKNGAGLINDVRSLRRSGALEAAAQTGLPICLMHMQGEPHNMQQNPHYVDVVQEVLEFLDGRINACIQAGIKPNKLLIDPGFGFAKNLNHNLKLMQQLPKLQKLNLPILVGVSRKSMIGQVLNLPVNERLAGSLALASLATFMGAKIIRCHEVAQTVQAVKMVEAVMAA